MRVPLWFATGLLTLVLGAALYVSLPATSAAPPVTPEVSTTDTPPAVQSRELPLGAAAETVRVRYDVAWQLASPEPVPEPVQALVVTSRSDPVDTTYRGRTRSSSQALALRLRATDSRVWYLEGQLARMGFTDLPSTRWLKGVPVENWPSPAMRQDLAEFMSLIPVHLSIAEGWWVVEMLQTDNWGDDWTDDEAALIAHLGPQRVADDLPTANFVDLYEEYASDGLFDFVGVEAYLDPYAAERALAAAQ